MTVKDMKEILKKFDDDTKLYIAKGNSTTELFELERCCNLEHQEKVNEIWMYYQFRKGNK
jgi:hypothetical protein